MAIRKVKGKWDVGYKDTYSLSHSLGPIIFAGLKKFHDVLVERNRSGKAMGIPHGYMKDEDQWVTDSDVQDWLDDIKKMMYAFDQDSEPNMKDYNFSYSNSFKDREEGSSVDLTCSNPSERERYRKDMKEWQEKVEEGLKLFGEKYQDLWW